ncbi:formimidoylglutamate deiminase [Euzebya sp.]|uniref:formimidoylglutamate deiminase n=1 Tax=Euzebya sp. TaxID=1971409 RepID=UPI0035121436
MTSTGQRFRCDHALVDGTIHDHVALTIHGDRIAEVVVGAADLPASGTRLAGLVLPGLVNAHSHAFHRALRGRTQRTRGSFWTWRDQMYAVAEVLDPDTCHALARAAFGEMALAGITCVGEFHYLHHAAGGVRYTDANAMGRAIVAAAGEAGVRLTLLDTLYLTGAVGATPDAPGLTPIQGRFSDGSADEWAARVADLAGHPGGGEGRSWRVGAAVHSVRAVPPDALSRVAALVHAGGVVDAPAVVHAHVAEQPDEVEAARAVHGRTPVQLLADAGLVSSTFTAVHGVWLDDHDVRALGAVGATVCACPTTERDLADGVVAGDRLDRVGARLALGSDSHAVVDLLEEARALELDRRLVSRDRGALTASVLMAAATEGGAHSLGWSDAGRIAPGMLADLCVVGLGSVRLAGLPRTDLLDGVVFAGTAADVTDVMVGGRWTVRDGRHVDLDVPAELTGAIAAVSGQPRP